METKRTIEIIGETVEVKTVSIEKRVALEDWLAALTADRDVLSPILPEKCVLLSQRKDGGRTYVIQLPPQTRTVIWNDIPGCAVEAGRPTRYKEEDNIWRLSFPYVVFVLHLNSVGGFSTDERCFYRNEPLRSEKDTLLIPNLGNLWSRPAAKICTGLMRLDEAAKTDAEKVNDYVSKFFSSPFNADLLQYFVDYGRKEPKVKDIKTWAESSAADPLFMLSINWQKGPLLKDVLSPSGGY